MVSDQSVNVCDRTLSMARIMVLAELNAGMTTLTALIFEWSFT